MPKLRAKFSLDKSSVSSPVPRLGELLIARGDVSPRQVATALARQQYTGRRLGDELVRSGAVKRSRVVLVLVLQRRLALVALLSSLAYAALYPIRAHAAGHATELGVRVFVVPNAVLQIDYQPPTLELSAADVARGYVDVAVGTRLRVTTNNRAGFVINLFSRLPIFKAIRVRTEEGRGGTIAADGGTLVERGRYGKDLPVALAYRFELADTVRPGTYAWPLALEALPL